MFSRYVLCLWPDFQGAQRSEGGKNLEVRSCPVLGQSLLICKEDETRRRRRVGARAQRDLRIKQPEGVSEEESWWPSERTPQMWGVRGLNNSI